MPNTTLNVLDQDTKEQALSKFLDVFKDTLLLSDIASSLNCCECDALAELLIAHGHERSAYVLIEHHINADECSEEDHQHVLDKIGSKHKGDWR